MTWTDGSLNAHVQAWLDHSLPRESWSPHASHLATTVWHVRRYPFAEALRRMREGILAYNISKGLGAAYHDTVTVVYVHLVHEAVQRLDSGQSVGDLANAVIDDLGVTKERREALFRRYYSDLELLKSDAARRCFLPPDLAPLP
jgi:hypothetical protein